MVPWSLLPLPTSPTLALPTPTIEFQFIYIQVWVLLLIHIFIHIFPCYHSMHIAFCSTFIHSTWCQMYPQLQLPTREFKRRYFPVLLQYSSTLNLHEDTEIKFWGGGSLPIISFEAGGTLSLHNQGRYVVRPDWCYCYSKNDSGWVGNWGADIKKKGWILTYSCQVRNVPWFLGHTVQHFGGAFMRLLVPESHHQRFVFCGLGRGAGSRSL